MSSEIEGQEIENLNPVSATEKETEVLAVGILRAMLASISNADNKASIMISINGLIVSLIVLLSNILVKENNLYIIPLAVWLAFSLGAMFLAVLSAQPQFLKRKSSKEEDYLKRTANIMYFGDITSIDRDSYTKTVEKVLRDHKLVNQHIFSYLHGLASSVERKYSMLRKSYGVFLFGLFAFVISFSGVMISTFLL